MKSSRLFLFLLSGLPLTVSGQFHVFRPYFIPFVSVISWGRRKLPWVGCYGQKKSRCLGWVAAKKGRGILLVRGQYINLSVMLIWRQCQMDTRRPVLCWHGSGLLLKLSRSQNSSVVEGLSSNTGKRHAFRSESYLAQVGHRCPSFPNATRVSSVGGTEPELAPAQQGCGERRKLLRSHAW